MQELVMHLIDERGPIRLGIELAIAIGSLAFVAGLAHEAVARRGRRGTAVSEGARPATRRAA